MSLKRYLSDHWLLIFFQSLIWFFLVLAFILLHAPLALVILLLAAMISMTVIGGLWNYQRKKAYYAYFFSLLEDLEDKTLMATMMEKGDFIEAEYLYEAMQLVTKSARDDLSKTLKHQENYKDYIETWIHEIKRPITAIDLLAQNNPTELMGQVKRELRTIERYTEQALYFSKSQYVAEDYHLKWLTLETLIKNVLKRNSRILIDTGAIIHLEETQTAIIGDSKWIEFIIEQVIMNSVQYKQDKLDITFEILQKDKAVSLKIQDRGIGIPQTDLTRVFEKGFTGENGRRYSKSTGMGLYLCQSLCQKLHIEIAIDSKQGEGTCVTLVFPLDIGRYEMLSDNLVR